MRYLVRSALAHGVVGAHSGSGELRPANGRYRSVNACGLQGLWPALRGAKALL